MKEEEEFTTSLSANRMTRFILRFFKCEKLLLDFWSLCWGVLKNWNLRCVGNFEMVKSPDYIFCYLIKNPSQGQITHKKSRMLFTEWPKFYVWAVLFRLLLVKAKVKDSRHSLKKEFSGLIYVGHFWISF